MTMQIDEWDPTPTKNERRAIHAVVRGQASESDQMLAMKWILHRACGAGLSTFHPDPLVQSHRAGRREVSILITKILTQPVEQPEDSENV